jgi:hypothetical protein
MTPTIHPIARAGKTKLGHPLFSRQPCHAGARRGAPARDDLFPIWMVREKVSSAGHTADVVHQGITARKAHFFKLDGSFLATLNDDHEFEGVRSIFVPGALKIHAVVLSAAEVVTVAPEPGREALGAADIVFPRQRVPDLVDAARAPAFR